MLSFGCLAGNDDFGTGCGPNGWQSRVTVTANSRWLYLVVQGYFGATVRAASAACVIFV